MGAQHVYLATGMVQVNERKDAGFSCLLPSEQKGKQENALYHRGVLVCALTTLSLLQRGYFAPVREMCGQDWLLCRGIAAFFSEDVSLAMSMSHNMIPKEHYSFAMKPFLQDYQRTTTLCFSITVK